MTAPTKKAATKKSTDIVLPSEKRKSLASTIDPADAAVIGYLGLNQNNPAHRAQVAVARHYDLDAVLKHIVVIPNAGVYITRDGLLHVAHRSGQLDGIVVEQEPTLSEDGKEWVARVSVWRKDMSHPFTYPGRYPVAGKNKEYAQEMAMKAAEAHALRRAFTITGLPAVDEQRPESSEAPDAPARSGHTAAESAPDDSPQSDGASEVIDGEVVEEHTDQPSPELNFGDAKETGA